MLNGVAQSAIAVALAATVGGSVLLKPSQRSHEEAAFLERVGLEGGARADARARDKGLPIGARGPLCQPRHREGQW